MTARIDLPMTEIVTRYEDGENTYQLGRVYGVAASTIARHLKGVGFKLRSGGFPFGHSAPLGNTYGCGNKGRHKRGGPLHVCHGHLSTCDRDGRQCYVHRGCWEAYHGPIAKGRDIHHIDEDRLNYHVENLACVTRGEHMRLHAMNRRIRS